VFVPLLQDPRRICNSLAACERTEGGRRRQAIGQHKGWRSPDGRFECVNGALYAHCAACVAVCPELACLKSWPTSRAGFSSFLIPLQPWPSKSHTFLPRRRDLPSLCSITLSPSLSIPLPAAWLFAPYDSWPPSRSFADTLATTTHSFAKHRTAASQRACPQCHQPPLSTTSPQIHPSRFHRHRTASSSSIISFAPASRTTSPASFRHTDVARGPESVLIRPIHCAKANTLEGYKVTYSRDIPPPVLRSNRLRPPVAIYR
jgi:ferredoxin